MTHHLYPFSDERSYFFGPLHDHNRLCHGSKTFFRKPDKDKRFFTVFVVKNTSFAAISCRKLSGGSHCVRGVNCKCCHYGKKPLESAFSTCCVYIIYNIYWCTLHIDVRSKEPYYRRGSPGRGRGSRGAWWWSSRACWAPTRCGPRPSAPTWSASCSPASAPSSPPSPSSSTPPPVSPRLELSTKFRKKNLQIKSQNLQEWICPIFRGVC